jgi:hypothetical protein
MRQFRIHPERVIMDDPVTTSEPSHAKAEQGSRIFEASRSFGITPEQYMNFFGRLVSRIDFIYL